MFAVAAAVVFLLALLGVDFGPSMLLLGLLLVAIHLAIPVAVPWRRGAG